jgi:putative heme-binding domain-containing protein
MVPDTGKHLILVAMTHKFCLLLTWLLTHSMRLFAQSDSAELHNPSAELASFQIADGFEVNLFASEKDGVVKPIQIRFDARGRLWVIGSTVYPQIEPGQIPNDKILVLEDSDHDGRCDKTTVFAQGLMIPTGIELGDGGVYLGHGTELLFLKDTNGDGQADERHVVLRGFGTGDNHQNINSFRWGPGGELWMSQGLHIFSRVETPWGIARLHQAGLWRLWPRRLKLEGFYGSEYEPQNPWGFVFTDWGEPIVLAGNNSSPIYPVPGLVLNHRDTAPALIWKNGNGRKVSGGEIVGTAHFPDVWQGALLVGGYINNAVWTLKISDDGAGFLLEDLPPLIRSTSRSFRPVDVKFGPDGALYVCDWYNPIIGHYQASFRDPNRDKTHGRIWRVTAKGRPLTQPPQLAEASIPQLLDHLKSRDRWARHFAKRVLADRPADQVVAALKEWTARPDLTEHDLMEALGVYQSHETVEPNLLERLCRAKVADARAYAAGVVGTWADRLPNPLALLRPLVGDENPRVRLQAFVACSYVPSAEAMEVAAVAADFPADKFLSYALNQVVFALKPHWLPAFKTGRLNLENKPARLSWLVRADATADTLQAVRELARSSQSDASSRETFLRILIDTGTSDDLAAILKLSDAALQTRLFPALSEATRVRRLRPSGDLTDALRPLIESAGTRLRSEALKLAGVWKLESFRLAAETLAFDAQSETWLRRAAIDALASFGGDASQEALSRLAGEPVPRVQSASIAALAGFDVTPAAQKAADWFERAPAVSPSPPGGERAGVRGESERLYPAFNEIFSAFLQRQGGAAALANALSAKPPPKPAAETGLAIMSASGRRDERLAALLSQAAGLQKANTQMTPEEIAAFIGEVRDRGDARRGAEVFRRPELGCVACHAVNGEGGVIGPNLSALGTAQPLDFIIGAILDPQREIKEGYLSTSLATKDGEDYQGYLVRESPEEIVLRDVLQNREVRLRRDAIRERRQTGSVMPSGLADTLTRAEFRDLVRYLSELGRAR